MTGILLMPVFSNLFKIIKSSKPGMICIYGLPAAQPWGQLCVNRFSTKPFSWISAYFYACRKVYPLHMTVYIQNSSPFNIQLWPKIQNSLLSVNKGSRRRIRTFAIMITNHVLYHLSYLGNPCSSIIFSLQDIHRIKWSGLTPPLGKPGLEFSCCRHLFVTHRL